MQKTQFLTIFPTFEKLETIKQTLPSIIDETKNNDAKLIVHDSSVKARREKWDYLQELNKNNDFFLLLSDNLSMAHARNMCLRLGFELFTPDYVCMVEDDHGFRPGIIPTIIDAMKKYYGKKCPNGLKYGLFSGCMEHLHRANYKELEDGNFYPEIAKKTINISIGGANSCFRCAPSSHWLNVLKGYDTDEYLISEYQTRNLNFRNYNKGFTTMFIKGGNLAFSVEDDGRGMTSKQGLKLWDNEYTASDPRSKYLLKK